MLDKKVIREKITIMVNQGTLVNSHQTTAYYFTTWPSNDQFHQTDSENLLTLIRLIQRDIGKPEKVVTIVSHDPSGGVEGASSFLVLFQMLQELDTKLKVRRKGLMDISRERKIEYINVFEKVDGMRRHRAHMVSSFSNYKFIFSTLAYYAKNKSTFDKIQSTMATVIKKEHNQETRRPENQLQKEESQLIFEEEYALSSEEEEEVIRNNSDSDIYVN